MLPTKIDALLRQDHWHLTEDDECYALREYTAGGGYQAGESNQLIVNLKKPPERRALPEWRYKEQAIRQAGTELRGAFSAAWLNGAALVPMPPSAVRSDPAYDDRMVRVVAVVCDGTGAELRELLVLRASVDPHHLTNAPREVSRIAENYEIDEGVALPPPTRIAVVDDVLTTGAHFRAAKAVLLTRFPEATVIGVFVARRVIVRDEATDK